jgi:outer membrane protein
MVREAIAGIAKAEGYTQIITSSGNELAYVDETYDITQKVMAKLGVKMPPPAKK